MRASSGATEPRLELLDIHGVAARLGVTERHIRRLVAERRIPYLKWGHLLRFDPLDIDAWLDTARRPAVRTLAPPNTLTSRQQPAEPEVW